MEFLGPCEVCGKVSRSYRSLAQHLRHNQDKAHAEMQARYRAWKDSYHAVLRCRKCGQTWEITDKARRNEKNCPTCRRRKVEIGKRAYEALSFDKVPDPRPRTTIPSKWRGVPSELRISTDDPLFGQVLRAVSQVGVKKTSAELGVPYQGVRRICVSAWGRNGYQELMSETRQRNVKRAAVTRRAFWANLSPEERAERIARWHRKGLNNLESSFWTQLQKGGLPSGGVRFHVWKTVPLGTWGTAKSLCFAMERRFMALLVFSRTPRRRYRMTFKLR
jgi:hypothetical protein